MGAAGSSVRRIPVALASFDRHNIVSEDDLWMVAQKTTMYVDTLPTTHVSG